MFDTIAAISTALGIGAISIIRLSGNESINIVNSIFKGKNLNNLQSHSMAFGYIVDKDEIIDEVLVSVMKSPKTFTTEDIVEINCHGGISTTNKILELVIKNGARLAEPGEFTKRAYLNGRLDLVEAEGVMNLINSKTEKSRKMAINQLNGKISKIIRSLREKFLKIISNIEVNIDYPEYEDILVVTNKMIEESILDIKKELKRVLKESKDGKLIKEGINVLIIGRPNVGKSSLLNKLIDEEKAIVTDIEGTTRDIVEGNVSIDGVELHIIDTAGIRNTNNKVEKIGVEKSLSLISKADLVILVLNNNEALTEEDIKILNKTKDTKRIIFVNKADLKKKIDLKEEAIYGNTKSDDGIKSLKNKIKEMFNLEELDKSDLNFLSNASQIAAIEEALKIVEDIEKGIKNNLPIDILEIDIRKVWELLGNIIGENTDDELINNLFKNFCVGK